MQPPSHPTDLIVWPEAPAPFSWQDNQFSKRASSLAIRAGHPFLAGVIEWKTEKLPPGRTGQAPYNSAILVDPQGQKVFAYDKRHLVPFGEYEPFPLIHRVVQSVSDEVGGFHKGTVASRRRPPERLQVRRVTSATKPFIPAKFASSPPMGANLLDKYFQRWLVRQLRRRGTTPAMARVRAVENRRWMLRVTNSGITAAIDPYGTRRTRRIPRDVRGAVDLPYDFRTDTTLYTRFGDWFAWMCVLVSVILLLQLFGRSTT